MGYGMGYPSPRVLARVRLPFEFSREVFYVEQYSNRGRGMCKRKFMCKFSEKNLQFTVASFLFAGVGNMGGNAVESIID
jgi:hypothetical protein